MILEGEKCWTTKKASDAVVLEGGESVRPQVQGRSQRRYKPEKAQEDPAQYRFEEAVGGRKSCTKHL